MQVLVAIPGEEIMMHESAGGSEPFQQLVGGSLECMQLGNGYMLYCNQNSNELDLPVNPHFAQGIIKGPFVIAKKGHDGKIIVMDRNDISFIRETFLRNEPEVIVHN